MKNGKSILGILSVFLVLATISISATADGVNQTSEIQGITTSTYIDVVGMASNNVELAWTSRSGSIQDNPPLSNGEVVQTTVYTENTNAMNGHTVYIKEFSIDTGNKVVGQSNVESDRQVTFEGYDGGNMVSDESLLIDTVGNPRSAAGQFVCPFGPSATSSLPAYCNIVTAGSHVDSSVISFRTQASSRTVMVSADVPVALAYSINAHGVGTANGVIPAQGSVSSYMKVHLQGGSGNSTSKASDLTYEEKTSANGIINSFMKTYGYESGSNTL
ncbi:MAG: hypothetical protein WCJ93_08105 [Methanomicrobiales archaeon]